MENYCVPYLPGLSWEYVFEKQWRKHLWDWIRRILWDSTETHMPACSNMLIVECSPARKYVILWESVEVPVASCSNVLIVQDCWNVCECCLTRCAASASLRLTYPGGPCHPPSRPKGCAASPAAIYLASQPRGPLPSTIKPKGCAASLAAIYLVSQPRGPLPSTITT